MSKAKLGVLFIALCVFCACAPAMKSEIKVDPAFKGKLYSSFLILGFSDDYKQRKAFEYDLAEIMRKRGLKAVPSLAVLGDEHRITQDIIKAAAKKAKAQAVLMAYYAGAMEAEKPKAMGDGPDYDTLPSFFSGAGLYRGREDYSSGKKFIQLECNIYDVASEKQIVSGATKLKPAAGMKALTAELADIVLGNLKSKGMLP